MRDVYDSSKEKKGSYFDSFEWYEISHFSRVAKEAKILEISERRFLYSMGERKKQISKGYSVVITSKEKKHFDEIFEKMLKLLPQDFHCSKPYCDICRRLNRLKNIASRYETKRIDDFKEKQRSWEIKLELYEWQKECLNKWINECNSRGIVKVVTGAGKTVLALKAISVITEKGNDTDIRTFIVVPKISLLHQWKSELMTKLNVDEGDIGVFYGEKKANYYTNLIQIYVINTARKLLPLNNNRLKRKGIKTLLIADECHNYGSKENRKIFETKYDWTLGLSATPRRKGDRGDKDYLFPNLGEIFYEYNFNHALRDRIIPPFELINCLICLSEEEKKEYDYTSEKITDLLNLLMVYYPQLEKANNTEEFFEILNIIDEEDIEEDEKDIEEDEEGIEEDEDLEEEHKKEREDSLVKRFKKLIYKRRTILYNAVYRFKALNRIIKKIYREKSKPRIIIFHESINSADKIYTHLVNQGYEVTIYHSNIPKKEREYNLHGFRRGLYDILVACKALDEGLDVPNANIGIIAAATKSVRQRIQRFGRILRKTEGKKYAQIYTIYMPELESEIFNEEEIKEIIGLARVKTIDFRKEFCNAKDYFIL